MLEKKRTISIVAGDSALVPVDMTAFNYAGGYVDFLLVDKNGSTIYSSRLTDSVLYYLSIPESTTAAMAEGGENYFYGFVHVVDGQRFALCLRSSVKVSKDPTRITRKDLSRVFDYRIDVIKNGVRYKTLRAVSAPTANADTGSAVKSSLGGTFVADDDIDFLRDELRAWQIIDGVEHSLGIFATTTLTELVSAQGQRQCRIEAYDRGIYAKQTVAETRLHFAAGRSYIDVISSLLQACGIKLVRSTPSDAVLQTERADWEIGTSYLEIINELLGEINYLSLFFDSDGYAVLAPAVTLNTARSVHVFSELEPGARIMREMQRETDLFDAPNVFIVFCQNPDLDEPLKATAVNDNPVSASSTVARGRRIAQVTKVNNVATLAELQTMAQTLCNESMTHTDTVVIKSGHLGGVELNDAVALDLNGVTGVYTESGWRVTMQVGEAMTHTLTRRVI